MLPPAEADIWILAGQSNMAGAGRTKDTSVDGNVWMLNMDRKWMVAQNPLHRVFEATAPAYKTGMYELTVKNTKKSREEFDKEFKTNRELSLKDPASVAGVGPGLYFGRRLANQLKRPVALIPCALGGSTIELWNPLKKNKGDSSLYGALLNSTGQFKNRIRGILWSQGESEAMLSLMDTYEEKLLSFIDHVREDLGNPDLPFIIIQIGRMITDMEAQQHNWEVIREIQRRVAGRRKNVFLTTGIDLPLDDAVHTSTAGQKRLGYRMAEVALSMVYKMPGHGTPINLESVSLKEDKSSNLHYLKLHFSGVSGKLNSCDPPGQFEIRIDGKMNFMYTVCRTELDPEDPAGIKLFLSAKPPGQAKLFCGKGTNPVMNVTDDLDMPLPAFGPVDVPEK
ncbi:MAG: sialate O-acetylesterase [Chitinophagaceae bacterium]|nr:sialate O-acetylesterase [Chitinophagaceae bacterium]MCW5929246.1 sialate O-acetylesterase [Chitinophagaceae bacterium]